MDIFQWSRCLLGHEVGSIQSVQICWWCFQAVATSNVGFQCGANDIVFNFDGIGSVVLAVHVTNFSNQSHGRLLDEVLVVCQLVLDVIKIHSIRDEARKSSAGNVCVVLVHSFLVAEAHDLRDFDGTAHTNSDGFSVQQRSNAFRVERQVLNGVANGVTVLRDHFVEVTFVVVTEGRNLVVDAFTAKLFQVNGVAQSSVQILFQRTDNGFRHVTRLAQSVLESFGNAVQDVTLGASLQDFGVHHDVGGRVVGSKKVLSARVVTGLLEVDGGVGHSHHVGGDVDQSNTTVKRSSQETAEVVHNTSSQRDDARFLCNTNLQNLIGSVGEDSQSLVTFGGRVSSLVKSIGRNDELVGFDSSIVESLQDLVTIESIHNFVGDEEALVVMTGFGNVFLSASGQVTNGTIFNDNVGVQVFSRAVETVAVDTGFVHKTFHKLGLLQGKVNLVIRKVVEGNSVGTLGGIQFQKIIVLLDGQGIHVSLDEFHAVSEHGSAHLVGPSVNDLCRG